jgi:hypothetical protein
MSGRDGDLLNKHPLLYSVDLALATPLDVIKVRLQSQPTLLQTTAQSIQTRGISTCSFDGALCVIAPTSNPLFHNTNEWYCKIHQRPAQYHFHGTMVDL